MIPFLEKDKHWLNNNHLSPIRHDGYIFPTVWHAYTAAKTSDTNIKREIACIPINGQLSSVAARVVQQIGFNAPETMEELLKIKFGLTVQDLNPLNQMLMAKKLVHTGLQILEFGNHTCNVDWGVCYCSKHTIDSDLEPVRSTGKNLLGNTMMRIRDIWRLYIEEVNVISTFCFICSKPATKNVLFTPAKSPTFPAILESCDSCQALVFMEASKCSSDGMVINYDPFEKPEDPKTAHSNIILLPYEKEENQTTRSMLLNKVKYKDCPACHKLTSIWKNYCEHCYRYIDPEESKSSRNYQSPYQPPPLPPDRQYNSEEIIC
jgi:predicted NAD-dependent protein-ADP-ribosyltransferase YbiA (DUF1768 family)